MSATTNPEIERAIALFPSAAKFAEAVERSPQFVSQLRSGGRQVPAELCPLIESATNGEVRCEQLRPDVSWSVLRQSVTATSKAD